jgi:hypothetical protein
MQSPVTTLASATLCCAILALFGTGCADSGPDSGEETVAGAEDALTTCVTLTASADATLANPPMNQNFGAKKVLRAGGKNESLVKFGLGSIPTNAVVESAKLRLYVSDDDACNTRVTVHRATAAWSESTVTFKNFGERFDLDAVGVIHVRSSNVRKSVDLSGLVQSWVSGAQPNHGVLLDTSAENKVTFVSREGGTATQKPALEICYTQPSDHCSPNPCLNGGTCENGASGFTCECPPGYTGPTCATNIDDCSGNPCQNGGFCTDGDNGYTCACTGGFAGANCETNVDDCSPNPCQNGGVCEDGVASFTCHCAPGYTGSSCETLIDNCASEPCQNDGVCTNAVNGYSCTCAPGFTGSNCEIDIDDCTPQSCQNAGTCVDGINAFTCVCPPDFGGPTCGVNLNTCAQAPCLNGGACTNGFGTYTCACLPGFAGANCEIDIDDCAAAPCQNGGVCVDGVNAYTCECAAGFSGTNCEIGRPCEPRADFDRAWQGTDPIAPSSWHVADNWLPAGVPAATEDVWICANARVFPRLDGPATSRDLAVEAGASLDASVHELRAAGNVSADGTIGGSGLLSMTGIAATLKGTVPNLLIVGRTVLAGDAFVLGSATVQQGATLVVGPHRLDVASGVTVRLGNTSGTGLELRNALGHVIIGGNAHWTGAFNQPAASSEGSLTAGTISVRGDFVQDNEGGAASSRVFASTGTRVVFDGTSSQTIRFQTPGRAASRFSAVEIRNASGVELATKAVFSGDLTVVEGTVHGPGPGELVADLVDVVGDHWQVALTELSGIDQALPASLITDILWTGNTTLAGGFALTGNLTVGPGGRLTLNGRSVAVSGDLLVRLSNSAGTGLRLVNAADVLSVGGDATFTVDFNHSSATSNGNFTAGELRISGDFIQTNGGGAIPPFAFVSTGTTVVFEGSAAHNVSFTHAGASGSRFHHVEIRDGTVVGPGPVFISGNVLDSAGNRWRVAETSFTGSNPSLADMVTNATFVGSAVLADGFTLNGNLTVVTSAALRLNGNTVAVTGNLLVLLGNTLGSGLIMTNPLDTLVCNGNATFTVAFNHSAATSLGSLTAGVLRLGGTFVQSSQGGAATSASFVSTGTQVHFVGAAPQTASFTGAPSRFHAIEIAPTSLLSLATNAQAAADVDVAGTLSVPAPLSFAIGGELHLLPGSTLANSGTITVPTCTIEPGSTITGANPCP